MCYGIYGYVLIFILGNIYCDYTQFIWLRNIALLYKHCWKCMLADVTDRRNYFILFYLTYSKMHKTIVALK